MARIHHDISIDAPPARVFDVLTDATLYAECTGLPAAIDATAGGRFSTFSGRITGCFDEVAPARQLVLGWRAAHWPADVSTTVVIELAPQGDGTRLTLDHEGVPDDKLAAVDAHWRHRCLETLAAFAPAAPLPVEGARANVPAAVRDVFGWPEGPPADPFLVPLDGGGRFLVTRQIAQLANPTILEIGSFLGGSTRQWLDASPAAHVVAVDSWPDDWAGHFVARDEWWYTWPKPPAEVVEALNAPGGFYRTFLANLRDYADRVVPVRGRAEDMLPRLAALGLEPGLVYVDAGKTRAVLDLCRRLWPDAVLTGDDYLWGPEAGFPMRRHVHDFAAEHSLVVIHAAETWMLARGSATTPPPARLADPPPR